MRLDVRGRHLRLTAAPQDHVTRRLRFALGRFESSLRGVAVRVTDVNGPRGGIDKRCHIHVDVAGRRITIEQLDQDLYAAIDRAAERAGRAAERAIARYRDASRSPGTGERSMVDGVEHPVYLRRPMSFLGVGQPDLGGRR